MIQNVENWDNEIFDVIKQQGGDETEDWSLLLEQLNEVIIGIKENRNQGETEEQSVIHQKRRKRSSKKAKNKKEDKTAQGMK